jgi:CRP-like cAMP-binding protein
MTHWMCTRCGYYLQDKRPPDRCPSCSQACAFNDVTCYRPECGGESNLDPLLVGTTLGLVTAAAAPTAPPEPSPKTMEAMALSEILSGLNERQSQAVRKLGRAESYQQDDVICTEGAESRKLYLLEEGQVIVQSALTKDMSMPITAVSKGEAFGWSALVPPYKLTGTVIASSKVSLLAIDRDQLLSLMRSDPSMGFVIMQNVASMIAGRLRNLEQGLVGLVQYRHR